MNAEADSLYDLALLTDNFSPRTLISTSLKKKKKVGVGEGSGKKEGIRVLPTLKIQVPSTHVAFYYIIPSPSPHPLGS